MFPNFERLTMHRFIPALAFGVALLPHGPLMAQDASALDTDKARASYGLGLQIGQQLAERITTDVDTVAFTLAIRDVLDGTEPRLTDEELEAAFAALRAEIGAAIEARAQAKLEAGQAFLAENATKDDVTTTDSGLQYRVTTAGSGDSPTPEQTVTVHYEGRLLNGSVFDSSIARGEPATFPVGGVIQGWQEALQLMTPGATWEVWIPSELAYGPVGAGGSIGPNEVLNFTIELISIDG